MRPTPLPKCLLQVAAYGIALVPFANAQATTIYSTVTRYRISVVPQYTTYTDVSYSIITYTAPPSIQTEYVTATEVKRRTTTIFDGTTTVIEPASTVYASECSSTQSSSVAPSSDIFSSSATASSELASSSAAATSAIFSSSASISSEFASSFELTIPSVTTVVSESSTIIEEISTTVELPTMTTEPTETGVFTTEEPGATTQPPEPTRVSSAITPAGTYNPVECYPDDEANGFPLAPPITESVDPNDYATVQSCALLCSTANAGGPFRYAGIEPGRCFCSNGLLDAEPATNCSYPCPGNPVQVCGGSPALPPPPPRRFRKRAVGTAIIIYELEGFVSPTSAVVTDISSTEIPGATSTQTVGTEGLGASSTTEIIVTEVPSATSTEIIVTEGPSASSTIEIITTEEPGDTSTEIIPIETPGFSSTTDIVVTEEPVTSTEVIPTETPGVSPTTKIIVTSGPGVTSTEIIPTETLGASSTSEIIGTETLGASSTSEIIATEEPSTSTTGEAIGSSTGIPPVSSVASGASTTLEVGSTQELGATSTSEAFVSTEEPGVTSTVVVSTEVPAATTTSEVIGTEGPSTTSTSEGLGVTSTSDVIGTEGPSATSTSEVIITEEPGTTTTSEANTEGLGATSTSELVVSTGEPGATTTSEGSVSIMEPWVTTTSEIVISEGLGATTSGVLTSEGPESTTGSVLTTGLEATTTGPALTTEPGAESTGLASTTEIPEITTSIEVTPGSPTSTSEGLEIGETTTSALASSTEVEVTTGSPTSTSEGGEIGEATTSALASSTQSVEFQETTTVLLSTTSLEESSTEIPSASNVVSGSITTTFVAITSTFVLPSSTSSPGPSYDYVCAVAPSLFNVVIDAPGKPKQYLSQRNFPDAGNIESLWGYDTLPVVTSESQAAAFSIGFGNAFHGTLQSAGEQITGAVRLTALGAPLQLFTAAHISDNMRIYSATVGSDCSLGFDIANTGANILADCSGVFTILTPATQIQRGSGCTQVQAFAVAVQPPSSTLSTAIASTTEVPSGTVGLVTSSSTFSPIASSTSIAGCPVTPFFKILVNQTGMPPQYLWDPVPFGDDALSFTTDEAQSLTFSLSPSTGQLQFNIIDFFGNPVLLASNQDLHNPGNEAIFFSTATKFQQLGYQPVVATINPDCSIGLTLPYNAANIIQACYGSLYLMLSPGVECVTVSLLLLPLDSSASTSAIPSTSSFLV